MKLTQPTSVRQIKRFWYLVDVGGQIVGRMATKIATLLMGKSKPYFVRNLDCGDFVVVVNTRHVKVSSDKETTKIYTSYSGYPGGIRKEAFRDLKSRRPEEIIRRAVHGMLPKNKLRDQLMKRLYIFPEAEHPYDNKIKDQKYKENVKYGSKNRTN